MFPIKKPCVKKPKLPTFSILYGKTHHQQILSRISQKKVGEWWDYLHTCSNDTKKDRNHIYWEYKDIINPVLDYKSKKDFFDEKYSMLDNKLKRVLTKIYIKELKKR